MKKFLIFFFFWALFAIMSMLAFPELDFEIHIMVGAVFGFFASALT